MKWGRVIMELRATLLNHIPNCRSELKLPIMKSFSIVETVKEASAECLSFLDRVVIFFIFLFGDPFKSKDRRVSADRMLVP